MLTSEVMYHLKLLYNGNSYEDYVNATRNICSNYFLFLQDIVTLDVLITSAFSFSKYNKVRDKSSMGIHLGDAKHNLRS